MVIKMGVRKMLGSIKLGDSDIQFLCV